LEELVSDNHEHPAITEEEIRRLVSVVVDEAMAVTSGDTPNDAATIAIGADHGGFGLKQALIEHLGGQGLSVHDCGCAGPDAVDYPDFAHAVANLVGTGICRWGIVVDGAGIGSCMAANKVPGVRAALCYDLSSARNSREHNHANVLTLGAGLIGSGLARQIVDEWLATPWGPDRHARRVAKITDIEQRYARSGAGE
jgi:ribose 5-phosphate isomerase B